MEDKQSVKDYLNDRLRNEIEHAHEAFIYCTMSTIRWLKRYSNCYSIICSCICFPVWILLLPIAIALDICINTIILIIFIITFIIHILIAPCMLAYKFSSCLEAWNPANIFRYSLTEAMRWSLAISFMLNMYWMCYCGTGEIEGGAPICCTYCCCTVCQEACSKATDVNVTEQPCTIL